MSDRPRHLLPHEMNDRDLYNWASRNAAPTVPLPEQPDPAPAPGPVVKTLSDVTVQRIEWLWPGYLPAGKLIVIDGDPAAGKSTMMIDLAARCSTGAAWPDGTQNGRRRGVLLLSAEDGLADTIAPRLTAASADLRRVHALTDIRVIDDEGVSRLLPPSLPRDLDLLECTIKRTTSALVIIDVLMAYLSNNVDSHRDQDVRGVLHSLAAVAERTGATIALIRHLNKAGGGNALYRGGGSIGIIGAARAAFLVARDPDSNSDSDNAEDDARRVLAVTKMNIAPEPPSLAYRIESDLDLGCARIRWYDDPLPRDVTATSLLRGPLDADELSRRDDAAEWLVTYLIEHDGSASARDVFREGAIFGFSVHALKRAKGRRVTSRKTGMSGGWTWELRSDANEERMKGPKRAGQDVLHSSAPSGLPSVKGSASSDPPALRGPPDRCSEYGSHVPTHGHAADCASPNTET